MGIRGGGIGANMGVVGGWGEGEDHSHEAFKLHGHHIYFTQYVSAPEWDFL